MVVAQLVEQSFPAPDVLGSNPVISEISFIHSLSNVLKRRKLRKRGKERPIYVLLGLEPNPVTKFYVNFMLR